MENTENILNLIDINTFAKVELNIGVVVEAEKIEKSEKLLKLQVDLGELGKRQILSGIAKHYSPEEMLGKEVVVVTNLQPAKLMGIESQGMLLAAGDNTTLALVCPEKKMGAGVKVR